MRTRVFAVLAVCLLLLVALPGFGASKEIIQLQTMVQQLQNQMALMQQSFDERMGVMRNLIEQSTDNMNKTTVAINELQRALQQQHNDTGARTDQVSGQIQALNDSLDELKQRMTKLSQQLDAIQTAQQNLAAPPAIGSAVPGMQAPPPDVLYNNALRDYNSGKYDLASQEFADYLKYYPTTDLAGNAQFYIADLQYRQGNFEQAVQEYDKVLEQFPGGNKTAAAQLKKAFALLELGQRTAGQKELQSLIQRYPKTIEAQQARDRLKELSAGKSRKRPS